ncbi:MAG TPA: lytic murein transglycosylase [Marmoricola sp.]|jgi:membrane-bound lytic murein transglycosylase B|nr:lytic murein transglycosylase [Marmoricola sp.]
MAGKALTRKSKAATLVPLAALSAVWTASIVTVGTSATAAKPASDHNLPDGTTVPAQAIQAPASVPVPGAIAPAVPDGATDQVVASASTSGIPAPALAAYQRGAQIMDSADASCHIPWELIAAIGRVESDHGRYGGNTLTAEGVAEPGIYGPQLNGKNGTQAIDDTDGGELDNDPVFDRAVGPMQFIPSTWSVVKVDADGDTKRNPQDIDDAALATGVYLCSGTENLGTRQGQETAVYRYNHSHSYVNLVLRIMEAYSQGEYTAIPSGTYGGTLFTPSYTAAIDNQQRANTVAGERPGAQAPRGGSGGSGGSGSTPGGDNGGTPGTGGDDGTDSGLPGTPGTEDPGTPDNPVTKPLTDALDDVTTTVTEAASPVAKPVVDVLTATEALNLCSSQFAAIPDPLGLLKPLKDNCAAKVEGKTEADALALIPNTLDGILAWLT